MHNMLKAAVKPRIPKILPNFYANTPAFLPLCITFSFVIDASEEQLSEINVSLSILKLILAAMDLPCVNKHECLRKDTKHLL